MLATLRIAALLVVAALLGETARGEPCDPLPVPARVRPALVSVAHGTLRRWICDGHIHGYRAGRVLRVRAVELAAYLARPARGGNQEKRDADVDAFPSLE